MKKNILFILMVITSSLHAQTISMEKQSYYVMGHSMEVDTVCSLTYHIKNESSNSQVIMFSHDDINSLPMERLIKKKMYRRCGDYSLSLFVFDPNIVNESNEATVPDFFVKILPPEDSFNITLLFQNENSCIVEPLFRNHILVCQLEDVDCKGMFYGFKNAVDDHHLEFQGSSITLLWSLFSRWLQ